MSDFNPLISCKMIRNILVDLVFFFLVCCYFLPFFPGHRGLRGRRCSIFSYMSLLLMINFTLCSYFRNKFYFILSKPQTLRAVCIHKKIIQSRHIENENINLLKYVSIRISLHWINFIIALYP